MNERGQLAEIRDPGSEPTAPLDRQLLEPIEVVLAYEEAIKYERR